MKTTVFSRKRRLRLETLEDRCMLSVTAVSDFEDLTVYGPQQYWYGDTEKINEANSFTSGPCEYSNLYSHDAVWGYYHWAGFGYSRVTDNQTAGYLNDMSAYTGIGANGSPSYGVGYCDYYSDFDITVSITDKYAKNFEFSSLMVTNTTYAALSINGGDEFASPFEANDRFELIITGYDAAGEAVGSVTVTLADYTGGKTFVLDEWLEVDIASLKDAVSLGFTMSTTDFDSTYGPNTPLYFAIDDVTLVAKDEIVIDFEDVGALLDADAYWAGDKTSSRTESWFESGPCELVNTTDWDDCYWDDCYWDDCYWDDCYWDGWYWDGWSYSNMTDTKTEGYTNQFSAYPGGGAEGSSTYAVAYVALDFNDFRTGEFVDPPTTIAIADLYADDYEFASMEITNTTYAYLSMLNGDGFSGAFGPDDWLLLTILGMDGEGNVVDTINFYLAKDGYIVDVWTTVDLSQFNGQGIVALDFDMDSSDSGDYGMNKPAYFAADNIVLKKKTEITEPVEPQPGDVLFISTLDDVDDGVYTPGHLSFREAIYLANLWDGAEEIRFAEELTGQTIRLTKGEIAITSDITITGTGVTISGANQSRIFNIAGTSKNVIDVTIHGLTLADGYHKTYGGAVYTTYADTTWNDVTFADNTAKLGGAFYQNNRQAAFSNVTFSGNTGDTYGGAYYQKTGLVTFSAVTFISNTSTYGGAFYMADGKANFQNNSRFERNSAKWGGAVYLAKGEWNAENTTFVKNTSIWGGGLYLVKGNATLTDVTFSGNTADTKCGSGIAKTTGSQLTVIKNSKTILDTALAKYLNDNLL